MATELDGARYLSLSSYRRSGVPVDTPVWFAEDTGKLYVFSANDAGKIKRLRNSSRARVAACDVRGRLRGDWVEATARIVDDGATERRAYSALRAKYGLQMRLVDFFSRLSGRIERRAVIEIEIPLR